MSINSKTAIALGVVALGAVVGGTVALPKGPPDTGCVVKLQDGRVLTLRVRPDGGYFRDSVDCMEEVMALAHRRPK